MSTNNKEIAANLVNSRVDSEYGDLARARLDDIFGYMEDHNCGGSSSSGGGHPCGRGGSSSSHKSC